MVATTTANRNPRRERFGDDLRRYMKENPARRTGRVTIDLTRPQSRIFRCDARFQVIAAGRRFGKTTIAEAKLASSVMSRPGKYWYVGPTRVQAVMIAWEPLKELLAPITAKVNESKHDIRIKNGSLVSLKGGEYPDRLRGPGLCGIVFDEYAFMNPRCWEIVRPTLSDTGGWAMFIGSPSGRNHMYELFEAAAEKPDWERFAFRTIDGGWVTPEEIEAAKRDLDERRFREEYLATFETWSGLVYYVFDRKKHIRESEYNPRLDLCWCLDFNVDPCAAVIAQVEDSTVHPAIYGGAVTRVVRVLDEITLSPGDTRQACEAFAKWAMRYHRPGHPLRVNIYGDASGNNRHTSTGGTDWEVVRAWFAGRREFQIDMKIPRANPLQKHRVNAVNAQLENYAGEVRMTLHPRCKRLREDFEKVSWEVAKAGRTTGAIDKPKDAKLAHLTHHSDALGYLIHYEFGRENAGGEFGSGLYV